MTDNRLRVRKKSVVVEAVEWDETKETFALLREMGLEPSSWSSHITENYVRDLVIYTLEGNMDARKGDYIIKGVKGEFYPCKPDVYALTYESADAPSVRDALVEALRKLANEASGFVAMADPTIHGHTNIAVLKERIEQARAALAQAEPVSGEGV